MFKLRDIREHLVGDDNMEGAMQNVKDLLTRHGINYVELEKECRDSTLSRVKFEYEQDPTMESWCIMEMFLSAQMTGFITGLRYAELYRLEQEVGFDTGSKKAKGKRAAKDPTE